MPADQPRTRTVGCKMTDSEYERLAAVAEGDGMTLGEWVREVLLERAEIHSATHPGASLEKKKPASENAPTHNEARASRNRTRLISSPRSMRKPRKNRRSSGV
jgi:hypothetical protein